MDEAFTTLVGWVARRPLLTFTRTGIPFLSLRVGVTPARLNRTTGHWETADPTFLGVTCWRSLAENVAASDLPPGTPVIVHGRLRVRSYERDGERRTAVDLEAIALGPDLTRGTAHYTRTPRPTTSPPTHPPEATAPQDENEEEITPKTKNNEPHAA
ncbi:single-stranded DNA-binding protein [Actinocorallia sp. API 0066]|uniref:single-stranded DNA-binding protein n=1 Tax=Actinocorallia sp. API 0066 TaxID=2896846 RepID=UPI001E4FEA64|nr:single-stranded DNA-binding protein [Actinocorallia sp. API 0066]MCD0452788.1 single-stranded DNA-binding protein [Actinocorallia sp. API 0066]